MILINKSVIITAINANCKCTCANIYRKGHGGINKWSNAPKIVSNIEVKAAIMKTTHSYLSKYSTVYCSMLVHIIAETHISFHRIINTCDSIHMWQWNRRLFLVFLLRWSCKAWNLCNPLLNKYQEISTFGVMAQVEDIMGCQQKE